MGYLLELSSQEMGILSHALAALPYGQVAPLIAKIQQQVSEQEAAQSKKIFGGAGSSSDVESGSVTAMK